MFRELGLFGMGTFFGVICDNQMFMQTNGQGPAHSRALVRRVEGTPPYPRARPSLLTDDRIEDAEWPSELTHITIGELSVQN